MRHRVVSLFQVAAAASLVFSGQVFAESRADVLERIKPIGTVAVEGQAMPTPEPAAAPTADSAPAAEPAPVQTAAAPPARPMRPEQPRAPLTASGSRSPAEQAAASPAPPLPKADPRSSSFGFGAPLRPRVTGAADERTATVIGRSRPTVEFSDDPTVPPWTRLPARDAGRRASDSQQEKLRPKACGCSGPCRHHRRGKK